MTKKAKRPIENALQRLRKVRTITCIRHGRKTF